MIRCWNSNGLSTIFLVFLLLLISSLASFSANRYWIGAVDSDWNDTGNWSTSSGGIGGASVPGNLDRAIFNSAGNVNCDLDIAPTLLELRIESSYTATIDLNGNDLTIDGAGTSYLRSGDITNTVGTATFVVTSGTRIDFEGTQMDVAVDITCGNIYLDGSEFTEVARFTKNNTSDNRSDGGNVFQDSVFFTKANTGYFLMGDHTPDTFNNVTVITNSGASRHMYFGYNSSGTLFNDDVYMNNSGTGQIRIGGAMSGAVELAATKKFLEGTSGVTDGEIYFQNVTQHGNTTQSLDLDGDIEFIDCIWNGEMDITAESIRVGTSQFKENVHFLKTGSPNDNSPGGNVFQKDVLMDNTGAGYWLWGNGANDSFKLDLTVNASGAYNFYLAYNSTGNYVGGDFVLNKKTTGGSTVYFADVAGSELTFAGDVTILDSSTANSNVYLGDDGDVTINGDLQMEKFVTGSSHNFYMADNAASSVIVHGVANFIGRPDSSTSSTRVGVTGACTFKDSVQIEINSAPLESSRLYVAQSASSSVTFEGILIVQNRGEGRHSLSYLGYNGDITCQDDVYLINASSSTDASIYVSSNDSGAFAQFNGDLYVEQTHADADNILIGNTGQVEVASGKTVKIGAGGFIGDRLAFRRFTQKGSVDVALSLGSSTEFQVRNSTIGGKLLVDAGGYRTEHSTYNELVSLEMTGSASETSVGGNLFSDSVYLKLSGTGNLTIGTSVEDSILGSLHLEATNGGDFSLFQSADSSFIDGNLTIEQKPTTSNQTTNIVDNGAALHITGDVNLDVASASTGSQTIYFPETGALTIDGDVTLNVNSTFGRGTVRFANNASSSLIVKGNTDIDNSAAGIESTVYVGLNGDVEIQGTSSFLNKSTTTGNNRIYIGENSNSHVDLLDNIEVSNETANADGVYFGNNTGSVDLAAGKTIQVASGGFVAGYLRFRNFRSLGSTNQTLELTNDAILDNYDAEWGGDVTFRSPRLYTRGTEYKGEALLEKTGTGNDMSQGGNVFQDNVEFYSSGTGYFGMANSSPDSCLMDVYIKNTSASSIYFAHNVASNYIGGDLNSVIGSGSNTFCSGATSSLHVEGDVFLADSSSVGTTRFYFPNGGTIQVDGDFTHANPSSGTSSISYFASSASSSITIDGDVDISLTGAGTTKSSYLGNYGDVTVHGVLSLSNTTTANTATIDMAYRSTSTGIFNDSIKVEQSGATADYIAFGRAQGVSTLAATKTVSIIGTGFSVGNLYFRNFTQVGNTSQTLQLTGTGFLTNYTCDWGGEVDFIAPRLEARESTYQQDVSFENTGTLRAYSRGDNVFEKDAVFEQSGSEYWYFGYAGVDEFKGDVSLTNSGSGRLYFCGNDTTSIAGNLTLENTGTSGTPRVDLSYRSTANLLISGDVAGDNNASSPNSLVLIGSDGKVYVSGTLDANNNPSGAQGTFYIANGSSSLVSVSDTVRVSNLGGGTNKQMYLGRYGDIEAGGHVFVSNTSTATTSDIDVFERSNSVSTIDGNLYLELTTTGNNGIEFGRNNGQGTLASGGFITTYGSGVTGGELYLRNITQLGSAVSTLNASNSTRIIYYSSTFGGEMNASAGRFYLRQNTFQDAVDFTSTGSTNEASYGGNSYSSTAKFRQLGTSRWETGYSQANDFNGDVLYQQRSGTFQPEDRYNSTFAQNILIDFTSATTFGAGGGVMTIDGAVQQYLVDSGAASTVTFRRMDVNKGGGAFTLDIPLAISTNATFTSGVVNSDAVNILTVNDEATVSGASDNSHVDGPVIKLGNNAFTFPVGDDGNYQPIAMSRPSSNSASFRAQYFEVDPSSLYNWGLGNFESPIRRISTREYWTLDRLASTNNVTVTLAWDGNSGGVTDLASLAVARYDGTDWKYHGNGGTTGNTGAGTIQSLGAISSFSPFTLASTDDSQNPLPIELLSFQHTCDGENVQVTWSIAMELQLAHFELQQLQQDGGFVTVASQSAAGNSNITQEYTAVMPVSDDYIRLVAFNIDGSVDFVSELQKVDCGVDEIQEVLSIYPNPSQGAFAIELPSNVDWTQIELYNAVGEIVLLTSPEKSGKTVLKNVASGVYLVHCIASDRTEVRRVVVQ